LSASAAATTIADDDADRVARFHDVGFLILPGFLPADLAAAVRPEVDRWVDDGLRARSIACCQDPENVAAPSVTELGLPAHGLLVAHPPLMALMHRLMGGDFVFHHMHSDRHPPGVACKPWHHDYEQRPQRDRAHPMIHALHYLDGLDEDTAPLAVLPHSHRQVAEKDARKHLGDAELPGEIVIDRLPPGSTVVLHSALFHARRSAPSLRGRSRYLTDASYCRAGVRWPPVKPYWRAMLREGRELGLDRGEWPQLFAEEHFDEYSRPGA
jgi:hypothetical protein